MDINTEAQEIRAEAVAENKKGFFDPIEVKGLSAKSARAFSAGRFSEFLRATSKLLAFTSARVYGLIFLSFGVLTLFLHFAEYYFRQDSGVTLTSLVIGAVFVLLSLFFLASDKPICIALQSHRLLDFIVFDFFSINRMQKSGDEHGFGAAVGILIGFVLSILGFFFPTEYAALLIVGLIFAAVAMVSAEFPYIFSLLIFPYLSAIPYSRYILAALIIITLISFARKVLVGKRVYSFEIYDFVILFLMLAVLITGALLGGGDTESALFSVIFVLGYIPASNLAVNRRLFDCASGAVVASAIPLSLYSVIRYTVRLFLGKREAERAFFDSPELLSVYLAAVIVFSLYLSVKRSSPRKKRYYFFVFLLASLAALTTEYFAIFIALILSVLSVILINSRKPLGFIIIVLLGLPFFVFLLSDTLLLRLSDALSVSPSLLERGNGAWTSLCYFAKNLFVGMGSGAPISAPDVGYNTYLALVCRFGILAGMAFAVLLVLRIIHIRIFKRYYSDSTVSFYVDMCAIASVSMLLLGSFFDIFSQTEMIYFFVAFFGIGSAALRVSKKEMEENLNYYKDLGRSDSADVDVVIKC